MDGLLKYRNNKFSQNGEDGVIAEVLRRLQLELDREPWCVEFGAWDGQHLSNTFRLVVEENWNAVYIEGDGARYSDLESSSRDLPKIRAIHAMVSPTSNSGSSLDELLSVTEIPNDYELLSIDVDSFDLEIWAAHRDYRPKIVCIEINSSLVPGIRRVHNEFAQGNSFTSMVELARSRSYTLVCHTGNLIFVDDYLVSRLELPAKLLTSPNRSFLPFALPRFHPIRVMQYLRRMFGDSSI